MKAWRWAIALVVCWSLSVAAQHWLNAQRVVVPDAPDSLYLSSGEMLKRASIGFDGLLADVYWMRTVLYFGENFERQRASQQPFDINQMPLLEPLLNVVTELDPQHIAAYRLGGYLLSLRDAQSGAQLLERGLRSNPHEWRLYQDLGFLSWRQGDFRRAADWYQRGSQITGAPAWMQPMAATILAKGGDRETARALFTQLLATSEDEFIRQLCAEQLQLLGAAPAAERSP